MKYQYLQPVLTETTLIMLTVVAQSSLAAYPTEDADQNENLSHQRYKEYDETFWQENGLW